MIKKLIFLFAFFLMVPVSSISQWKGREAPPYLAEEIFRLSKDCYYFKEYLLVKQNKHFYLIASFLNRAGATSKSTVAATPPVSPCGKRMQQVRLYRWINDKKAVFKDSLFIDDANISLGTASDFDNAGTTKFIINHVCDLTPNEAPPVLCYALSIYEITKRERFRNTIIVGNVPERYRGGNAQGYPLEPVVSDNFDKTPFPECLAVDDFFEGDLAFRADDFPKVTLLYTWDVLNRVYKHHSDKFPQRFSPPASVDSIPDSLRLVPFIENVMALAAVRRYDDALKYIALGMNNNRVSYWKQVDPARAQHIDLERLRSKLLTCIARYKTTP